MFGSNGAVRCVVIVDESLPPGLAANATGVLSVTLGATLTDLPGAAFVDADGETHPGLIPQGLPVLRAPAERVRELRERAAADESVGVVDFPTDGQQTNDYDEFRRRVAGIRTAELRYLAILIYGPRRAINQLTAIRRDSVTTRSLALLR